MWAILGVGVMAVLGIVVVGILLLTRKPEPPAVAPTTAAGAAAGGRAGSGTPAVAAALRRRALRRRARRRRARRRAVAQNDKARREQEARGEVGDAEGARHQGRQGRHGADGEDATAAARPRPRRRHRAPKKGKHDALDDLLNDASPEPAAKPKKAAAAREEAPAASGGGDDSLPDSSTRAQIVSGMPKVKGARAAAATSSSRCRAWPTVALTIGGAGRVSSANVTGQFAGTPTGDCVSKAVKSAGFPKFKGSPQSIVYPFMLR